MSFRPAIAAIVIVLGANAISLAAGIYRLWPNVDVPLHLGGGFAMGLLALGVLTRLRSSQKPRPLPDGFSFLFVLSFAALAAVLWEIHEFLMDHFLLSSHAFGKTQLSLADTIGDLVNGLIGAGAAWVVGKLKDTGNKN